MNCIELFLSHSRANPKKMALWLPGSGVTTFGELEELARSAQHVCRENGVGPGDSVLLLDSLGPRLYGAVIGVLGLGASVILVEPWMPVEKINHVIALVKPKMFLTMLFGRFWGYRVSAVRAIPHWVSAGAVGRFRPSKELHLESVDALAPGIITFTSGTTGNPKGVVRHQGYLVRQHEVLSANIDSENETGPDLCIFANFALLNLASGRGSLIIPPSWNAKALEKLEELRGELAPVSLTCGPAFLMTLLKSARVPSLKSIHVGGALTDCWIFEEGFKRWPDAHWTHIYGSSEAEPVALADAHEAVRLSRSRGFFQTLYLGKPVPQVRHDLGPDGAWITGPHVCPLYMGNDEENQLYKRRDSHGNIWHFMGDRVVQDSDGWWYSGRSGQNKEDFDLEQRLAALVQRSSLFVQRNEQGEIFVLGEKVKLHTQEIKKNFQNIKDVVEIKIYRDRRHRARIDRPKSLRPVRKILGL